ncbi:MAG TPA: sensor histidine kinase, partial [Edaphobacter sp.]|nr:sensor histidine kinase [Edaphobacter sp.]
VGRTVKEALPELVDQGFLDLLNQVFQTGKPFFAKACEARLTRAGKSEQLYVDFTYYAMCNLAGTVEGIFFLGIDVTEQVLARSRLEERVRERTGELERAKRNLRSLNHKLMLAQDEERRRLALNLHDSVGQLIAALQWKLVSAQGIVYHSEVAGYIAVCLGLAEDISKEIRTIAHLLYPPVLDEAGLSPALHSYIEGMRERSGLSVSVEIDPGLGRFSKDLETAVFRIVQESLTNIHRHAQTGEAFVRIYRNFTSLQVEIEDRGQGIKDFTSPNKQRIGVGLKGMRERVRQLFGHFDVRSGTNGTTVTATFPLLDATKSHTPYKA